MSFDRKSGDANIIKPISYTQKLQQKWDYIEKLVIELIECSGVHRFQYQEVKKVAIMDPLPRLSYDKPTSKKLQLQMLLNKEYSFWFQSFNLLLHDASLDILPKIRTTDGYIRHVIDLKRNPYLKATIEENKKVFIGMEKAFKDYLNFLNSSAVLIIGLGLVLCNL